ncbi:MAG: hybrid sensor histidine kinase/response regulator, partial [Terriglobia bacterium]
METGKITILVADDDPTLLNLLALILHTAGFEVLTARDGLDALAVARTHPGRIELLLSDVMMPGLDGPQLARQLKLAHPTMRV